eukprot:scaffold33663_cov32-Tisochrysis_lutea.AAC.2
MAAAVHQPVIRHPDSSHRTTMRLSSSIGMVNTEFSTVRFNSKDKADSVYENVRLATFGLSEGTRASCAP